MSATLADHARPVPEPSADSRPYWDGLREHRLLLQRCARCHTVRHYPRPVCAHCHALDCDWVEASGRGAVHSWTISHHAFHPAFKRDVPFVTVTVDLDAGVRMMAPLVDGPAAALAPGLAVILDYEDVSESLTLPRFRLCP